MTREPSSGDNPHQETARRHIVAIVQARMTSTRLPGKVLKPVLGQPLLAIQLARIARVRQLDGLMVAATTNGQDDPIIDLCRDLHVETVRGSEDDVLSRYGLAVDTYDAAHPQTPITHVMRLTSDCPLIDPDVIDGLISAYFATTGPEPDYMSNSVGGATFPRGLDTELFKVSALRQALDEAEQPYEREHVTPFIWDQPQRFRLAGYGNDTDYSHHRWTVDTAEDFELVCRILEALLPECPDFTWHDVLALLDRHPQWLAINRHVQQKAYK
ncbi:MAG: glycosyltransferase family protein [Cyanobacteria bacterium HKST-UBA04]|nr:glycosyltransferase family protein [Cyanobacteria bacterium HKST-UBA04]MCA9841172.1 glycosyltransferase family protein [Cyanobacteria bacterium HKST-UBA03]